MEENNKEDLSNIPSPQTTKDDIPSVELSTPNYLFYMNKKKSIPDGDYIENILTKWKGDFDLLEDHHGYIQWLFPNLLPSVHNLLSSALTREEAAEFRRNKFISERLVRSYTFMLEFYGMVLEDESTGKIVRGKDYKKRYNEALLTNWHNHLRVQRILMHLNNVGFRKYAIELAKFLKEEVYRNGDNNEAPPLEKIGGNSTVTQWLTYGDYDNDPKKKKVLDEICVAKSDDDYKASIFFEKFG